MRVDCPECAAGLDGSPGLEMVCPACMTPFLVPAEPRMSHIFEVQQGDAPAHHGMSRAAIREAIYVGRLGASTRVRPDGGTWQLIGGYPEFAAMLRVLGGDLAPMPGTRKLASWKREDSADADTAPSRATLPRVPAANVEPPHTPVVRPRPAPSAAPSVPVRLEDSPVSQGAPRWLFGAVAVALLLFLALGLSLGR